ncbi:MAG: IS4 family transposase [Melioribacteraceae bacterium]|nr:IS4 family transposase [Melioribacteraceae bacterium]
MFHLQQILLKMNQGKYVFAQITDFLPQRVFDRFVQKHKGNKHIRTFTCWNQMLCMVFGQLTNRDSLRDLIVTLDAHKGKAYHLGLGSGVKLATLAQANIRRDYRIYEEFAYHLIDYARRVCACSDFDVKVDGNVYAFDSTTIDLCLSVFWWAEFRKAKGGIKMHTLYDVKTQIPSFVYITNASVNDVNAMDHIPYEGGSYYIFDRGYNDFERLYRIQKLEAFFVLRARDNLKFNRIYTQEIEKGLGVKFDQIGTFSNQKSFSRYPEKLRRIKYYDSETNVEFVFLTNNIELSSIEIAILYKNRWQVELFFKWIKQHLKVKSFWGHTPNAVKTQLYCAIISYCLVAIIGKELKIDRSTYEILQILGISLLDKTPVKELLTKCNYQNVNELNCKQLSFSLF